MLKLSAISVVIPFYNRVKFLPRLLQSIVNQEIDVHQVFLIDNGSTKEELMACESLIKQYLEKGAPIIWLSTVKKGNANIARNLGLDISETLYVAFLDSDDWWEPKHLSASLRALQNSDRAGSYSGVVLHHPHRTVTVPSIDINRCSYFGEFLYRKKGTICQTSSYLVRKDRVNSVRWNESLKRHQDIDFFIRVHLMSSGWLFVNHQYVNFDVKDGGTNNPDYKSMIRFIGIWEEKIESKDLLSYFRRQVIGAVRRQAPLIYINYYKMRYIKATKAGTIHRRLACHLRYFEAREQLILLVFLTKRAIRKLIFK